MPKANQVNQHQLLPTHLRVVVIDLHEMDFEQAETVIQDRLNIELSALYTEGHTVLSVSVAPITASYTRYSAQGRTTDNGLIYNIHYR